MRVIQNPRYGLRIANFACANPIFDFAQTKNPQLDFLVRFGLRLSQSQPLSQKNHHVLADESRSRKQVEQLPHPPSSVSGFFQQFAVRPFLKTLATILAARHKFPKVLAHGMPILPDHQNATVGKHRQHNHRTGMRHDFPCGLHSPRLDHAFAAHAEHTSFEHHSAAQNLR